VLATVLSSERLYVLQDANWNTTGLVAPGGTLLENFIYGNISAACKEFL
jgi:hypothetical protein